MTMNNTQSRASEDMIVRFLHTQIDLLNKVLKHIEAGNSIDGYVDENIKNVEVELRWLRKFYFNN